MQMYMMYMVHNDFQYYSVKYWKTVGKHLKAKVAYKGSIFSLHVTVNCIPIARSDKKMELKFRIAVLPKVHSSLS